jgi:hypothetical protein
VAVAAWTMSLAPLFRDHTATAVEPSDDTPI